MNSLATTLASIVLPTAEATYLEEVVRTLRHRLGQRLVGVDLFGSAAYGGYEQGISDLDVQAVVKETLPKHERVQVAHSLSHHVLPCPARRLEFVLYAMSALNPISRHPQFELNFNTDTSAPDRLSLDPAEEPSHWFLLDLVMGRELGRSLIGPTPADVFPPIPRLWQLEAIADSLAWHRAHEPTSANTVLNACRGWRYAMTGTLGSKVAGAAWARQQLARPEVVEQAERGRQHAFPLDASMVNELLERVTEAVREAILEERRGG